MGIRISQGRGFGRIDASLPEAMPSANLLSGYKHGEVSWEEYESDYLSGLEWVRDKLSMSVPELLVEAEARRMGGVAFMCYEASPLHCHRRLFIEWLRTSSILDSYDASILPPG